MNIAPIESARQFIDLLKEHLGSEEAYVNHMAMEHDRMNDERNIARRELFENNKWFGAQEFGGAAVGKPQPALLPLPLARKAA